jgi:hypothetical protein
MKGEGHFHIPERMIISTPKMLTMGFQTFLFIPMGNLGIADDNRARISRDPGRIPQVVTVSMRDKDKISLRFFRFKARSRIPCNERIDQYFISTRFQLERGMPEPGNCCHASSISS